MAHSLRGAHCLSKLTHVSFSLPHINILQVVTITPNNDNKGADSLFGLLWTVEGLCKT